MPARRRIAFLASLLPAVALASEDAGLTASFAADGQTPLNPVFEVPANIRPDEAFTIKARNVRFDLPLDVYVNNEGPWNVSNSKGDRRWMENSKYLGTMRFHVPCNCAILEGVRLSKIGPHLFTLPVGEAMVGRMLYVRKP